MKVDCPNQFVDVSLPEVKQEGDKVNSFLFENIIKEETELQSVFDHVGVFDHSTSHEKTPFILMDSVPEETTDSVKEEHIFEQESSAQLYNCPLCDYNSQVKYYLRKHISRSHPNDDESKLNFMCPFCNDQFEGLKNYHQHCVSEHGGKLPKVNCNICFKEFASTKSANIHKKVAHENYRISCPQCDKEVTSKQGLIQHLKVHTGDAPSASKRSNSISIRPHISLDGEANKQFNCSGCDYSSPLKENVKKHVKTFHSDDVAKGKELLPCPNCDKTFLGVSNLHRHAKEEHYLLLKLDYTCNLCNKEFSKRSNLRTHIQSVHEGIRYKCEICDKELSTLGNKTLHMKNKHAAMCI